MTETPTASIGERILIAILWAVVFTVIMLSLIATPY